MANTGLAGADRPLQNYIPSLDGLRAVSIIIVFLSHAGLGSVIPGGLGVTIFFFISGFLISQLLFREFDEYGRISVKDFYIRRVFRLTPPLLCAISLAVVLAGAGFTDQEIDVSTIISQIFFFYNYYMVFGDPNSIEGLSVLWSLSVEEHFYFIWPAIFLLFAHRRVGVKFLVASLLMFAVWRMIKFYYLGFSEYEIYLLSDTRFDSIMFGCALSVLIWYKKIPSSMDSSPTVRTAILAVSAALLVSTLLVRDDAMRAVLRYTIQGAALMPVFYYAVTRPDLLIFRPLNWKWVARIGVYSYSIYLVHLTFLAVADLSSLPAVAGFVVALLVALASFLYAAAIFRYIELPVAKLRKRILKSPARPEAVGSNPTVTTATRAVAE